MADAEALLAQALAAHHAGAVAKAEPLYLQVLAADPRNVDASHGLGIIRHRQGRASEALALLTTAASQAPARPEIQFNLGLALLAGGNPKAAAGALQQAARLNPNWPEAQYDLGNALREAGEPEAASRAFRAALKLRPGYIQAEVNLANLLKEEGKLEQAIAAYRRVLARNNALPETQNNLGSALNLAGQSREAEAAFRAAVALKPDFPAALTNLGALLLIEGREARRQQGRAALRQALTLLATAPATLENLLLQAECHSLLTQYAEATRLLERCIALSPAALRARLELVETLTKWGDHVKAQAALGGLPATIPQAMRGRVHTVRAALLRDQGELAQAEAEQRRALATSPANPAYRYALATILIPAGLGQTPAPKTLAEGFSALDARIELFRPTLPAGRAWDGRGAAGKTILVHGEEGLGDVIQFARFIPQLAAAGARVILQLERPLLRLLGSLDGNPTLVAAGTQPPQADAWALIMSLPRLLGLPKPEHLAAPYLNAPLGDWPARLAALGEPGQTLRIGLAWAGNPSYGVDHLRSIAPASLTPLGTLPGITWVSLQRGAPTDAIPGLQLLSFDDELADMADTASLIASLDLVISVDTAVAHLAGALGKPVWLLNRFNSCWRWERGPTSVWYGSMRQFRQTSIGDWQAPIEAVCTELAAMAQARNTWAMTP